ncbi:MAG TPA: site-specific DNA-methyltransferase [Bryobacteraceae bacterium]|jgi:adenine-specific DNA-methyltransferase|nr:site-specific DNA-methyltransferase [Bryobacteraceae bacterium]
MGTKAKEKKATQAELGSIRHDDKRTNIPTEELRDFVADDEKVPKTLLYPRDPTLDPQLVWKGKDKQDSQDLSVPSVPIYIQEKIHPQALMENLRAQSTVESSDAQASLFADFNGIKFEDYIDFYKHGQNWTNRMILGDSMLVMGSLAEKEGLRGKVQMIYLDPPYGIRFNSNWQVSTRKRDVKDGKVADLTRQPEQIRAFRDTWELGVHSYLAYLRDRLIVARDLLTNGGSIFVQIGDENLHLVRCVLDEVFGRENSIAIITVRKTGGTTGAYIPATADFILWYAKDLRSAKYRALFRSKDDGDADSAYDLIELPNGTRRRMTPDERAESREEQQRLQLTILTSPRIREARSGYYPVDFQGVQYLPTAGEWKTHREGIARLIASRRIDRAGSTIRYVRYLKDFPAIPLTNTWTDVGGAPEPIYVVQTNPRIIERCLLMSTDPGDLVFDPTCGSGTTAFVAEQWGRRWITCDTSRVALALTRTRLMSARFPYYVLSDSLEGANKEAEVTGVPRTLTAAYTRDVKKGFVYKRIPHITLKSIANNEEIDSLHAEYLARLEPVRQKLNTSAKKRWQEWDIPHEAEAGWPQAAVTAYEQWWTLRRECQQKINESILRHAETEFLYDQPYEDGRRVRVSGPFTVESLSPHRVLSPEDEDRAVTEKAGEQADSGGDFVTVILENLRKSGIKGTEKSQSIKFDRLEPFAGVAIQAAGEFSTSAGKRQRVAVAVGPQYGTVGPDDVKEAAKEAVQGIGYDLLVYCGFAFDPHVTEEVKRYGRLTVQIVRMNPDLLMGDELLKKTGSGNLFMVFGEPDIEIRKRQDKKLEVEIRGVDVYDPTTQEIRSNSTDDIACWFIDTAYNGESFFVRHAYFTGAGDPYEKLKRALRAEVDESAWASLYSTKSRPFDVPKTKKIAVKVINHYGDEVLKVFPV